MRHVITSAKLAPHSLPFSAAVYAGNTLFFSGQVAQDPSTGRLVDGDAAAQTEQIFRNLAVILEAARVSFADVTRVGVYLTNMSDFAAMNAVYARHFEKPYPARTTIGVAALPLGAAIEIDMVVGDPRGSTAN